MNECRQSAVALALVVSCAAVRAQAPPQPAPPVPKPLLTQTAPVRECASLKDLSLPDTTIENAAVDPGNATVPASCRVTAITTHPPAGDKVRIWIALPMKDWNGRFQGIGGGGFSGGSATVSSSARRIRRGSTDTGHEGGSGSFAPAAPSLTGSQARQRLPRIRETVNGAGAGVLRRGLGQGALAA